MRQLFIDSLGLQPSALEFNWFIWYLHAWTICNRLIQKVWSLIIPLKCNLKWWFWSESVEILIQILWVLALWRLRSCFHQDGKSISQCLLLVRVAIEISNLVTYQRFRVQWQHFMYSSPIPYLCKYFYCVVEKKFSLK